MPAPEVAFWENVAALWKFSTVCGTGRFRPTAFQRLGEPSTWICSRCGVSRDLYHPCGLARRFFMKCRGRRPTPTDSQFLACRSSPRPKKVEHWQALGLVYTE